MWDKEGVVEELEAGQEINKEGEETVCLDIKDQKVSQENLKGEEDRRSSNESREEGVEETEKIVTWTSNFSCNWRVLSVCKINVIHSLFIFRQITQSSHLHPSL